MLSARERLRDWMERSKLTQRAAARLLGMHYTFLSQLLNDLRTPALGTAVRIERITGIPVEAWMPTEDGAEDLVHAEPVDKSKSGRK